MCGIIGVCGDFAARFGDAENDDARLCGARDLMGQRGPDGAGAMRLRGRTSDGAWFGHRRLSIQDLSAAGAQPMRSDCGRYVITYNGEVYNKLSLREQLQARGRRFVSDSDTEVIVNGYAAWGEGVVDKLIGMFAFAIWDCDAETVFLARDRLGMKPLYYAANANMLAFASDATPLHALGCVGGVLPDALALYLMLGYVPAPWCVWEGAQKLEPGATLLWRPGETLASPRRYWSPPDRCDGVAPSTDALSELLDEVVGDHLLSDVPVGVFLSGGLDSSLVASSARRGGDPDTLGAVTVAFPGDANDEAPIAQRTAEQIGLRWRSLDLEGGEVPKYTQIVARIVDEPMAYTAVVSQAAVSDVAARQFKVVLSGDGGDEVFGGYRWYEDVDGLVAQSGGRGALGRLSRYFASRDAPLSLLERHTRRIFSAFSPESAADIVSSVSPARARDLLDGFLSAHDAPTMPLKRRLQRIDLMTFCADLICAKVDRAAMAFSLEVRPPFLDHRLVELGLSAPICEAFDVAPKQALRNLARLRGLDFLLDEPKRGFSVKSFVAQPDLARTIDGLEAVDELPLRFDQLRRPRVFAKAKAKKSLALTFLEEWRREAIKAPAATSG